MSFLQGAFIAATAFAAIPLLLHLLTRRRLQDVALPSYMFLLSSKRRSLKILTVNQWLLLLLRMALLATLALAFAMPVADNFNLRIPGAASPSRVAIIIDDTPSMTRSKNGISIFDRAASAASKILKNSSRQDEISIVPLCGKEFSPTPGMTDASTFPELKISACGETLSGKIQSIIPDLENSPYSDKKIVVISDFQVGSAPSLKRKISKTGVKVVAVDMAPVETVPDARPVKITMPAFPLKGEEVSICVDVAFTESGSAAQVSLYLDGAKRGEQNIVAAENSAAAKPCFTLSFSETGPHVLSAVVTGDSFDYNNAAHHVFEVGSSIPVGLIGDEKKFSDPGSDSFYILHALRAVSGAVAGEKIATITTYAPTELDKAAPVEKVLVIPGDTTLTAPQVALLARFAAEGGGVFMTSPVAGDEGEIIAAGLFGDSIRISSDGAAPTGTYSNVSEIDSAHEIFKNKSGRFISNDLMTSRFSGAAKIEALSSETGVIASFPGGYLLLGERAIGKGRAIISASPFNTEATNLSLKPSFVPFILQIVKHLSNSYHEDVEEFLDREKIRLSFESGSETISAVNAINGHTITLTKAGDGDDIVYAAQGVAPGAYKAGDGDISKNFIISPYPGELDLSKTSKETITELAGGENNIIDASKNLKEEELLRKTFSRNRAALWFVFFGLAAILMLAECVIANRQ